MEIAAEQLEDAERYRLDFVLPYALTIKAIVASGKRDYKQRRSYSMKRMSGRSRLGTGGRTRLQSAVRMRLYIAQAAFDLAIDRGRSILVEQRDPFAPN